jgi:arylsulfatase A-like enzyme/Tfp pilus assembly protein PilF
MARTSRVWLLIAAIATLGGLIAAAGWWGFHSGKRDGPIVVISIDTLRADHLPLYGYRSVRTPAIDALARDAVVFDRAYSHSPQTLPSHTSILSGRLPFQHGVRDNVGFRVKSSERLLPALLRSRGYLSGGFVSAYVLRRDTGIAQGFDAYDDNLPAASPESSIGQVQRDGALTLAAADRWLGGRHDPRFFLFLHLYEPHKPYAPPARFARYAPYDGEIAYADELVGRFLDALRAGGWYEKATIVLLSDHGEGLGDHGEQEHGLFLYDDTIHVPLIVKLPGSRGAGRRITDPVQHLDLVPTLLAMAGADVPNDLAGRSLRPLLEDRDPRPLPLSGIYAESLYSRYHFGWSELYSLTDDRRRYIKAPREELYDLQRDPAETRNLAAQQRRTVSLMRASVERMLAGSPVQRPSNVSIEDQQKLQALGYVGTAQPVSDKASATGLADPKDKVEVLEAYRRAADLAGDRRYFDAIPLYRKILATDPEMADVWLQLAQVLTRAGLTADAVDAYRKVIALNPSDPGSLIGAGAGLLRLNRLDEAEAHARLAIAHAPAGAHELLAKIALARKDAAGAEREASLAHQSDPTLPLPIYVKGRVLYNQGKYTEALPYFQQAAQALHARTLQINELHFYIGDIFARQERYSEAEAEFKQEIALFPHNLRARASLAMLYRAMGRDSEAEQVVANLLRAAPTPEGYALATRLWTIFGERAQAAAIEAHAHQQFGPAWKKAATVTEH